jgi:hypothetical protein
MTDPIPDLIPVDDNLLASLDEATMLTQVPDHLHVRITHRRQRVTVVRDGHYDDRHDCLYVDRHLVHVERRVEPKGGATYVTFEAEDGAIIADGVAFCRDDECFNKKIGRKVALYRALADYESVVTT